MQDFLQVLPPPGRTRCSELEIVAEGPVLAIHQSEEVLAGMDEWNQTHHKESGLIERVRASKETHESAQQQNLKFLSEFIKPKTAPLCGNSVHVDRVFLRAHMPELDAFLHYRIIDVSSIKELIKRWYPSEPEYYKRNTHRALDDIRESIGELRHYREHVFKP